MNGESNGGIDVSPDELDEFVANGAVVLDVREEGEWVAGHLAGARHVPLAELPDHVDDLPSTTIVCVCRSGARSRRAALFLTERGLAARNLAGGLLGWAEGGGEMVTSEGGPGVVA